MGTDSAALKPVQDKPGDYELSGGIDFASVPALLKQGYDWLGSGSQVRISLSGVTHCNSAAIGLLLEWLRQARSRKTTLRFRDIPVSLLEIARASEVHDLLST